MLKVSVPGLVCAILVCILSTSAAKDVTYRQQPVDLGAAADYVLFSKTGISSSGVTSIAGDVGVSPGGSGDFSGFNLGRSSDGTYATSSRVKGKVYASDFSGQTTDNLRKASKDVESAYNDAAGRSDPDKLNFKEGDINGGTLYQGLYKWTKPLNIGGTLTISGRSTDVFIFQTDDTLTFRANSKIVLKGASPENIFWQSAGPVHVSQGANLMGVILAKSGISFNAGAKLIEGRVLSQDDITLVSNSISQP